MKACIGSFLALCFMNWPASAHHHYDVVLGSLHNNSLVLSNSLIAIFGLIASAAVMMSFLCIRISKTK